ncbi:uncharacterized protein LOC128199468 [Bicyclus anynana]|uniref:Uncharacterized protein LOC128199468 n=1 Tax=Bicyclus anynana TaxID=110368 RepID=A0ABM3M126_BICAN|nr:uncharacterized protein LOC128199468 [Bicyclus anynana]
MYFLVCCTLEACIQSSLGQYHENVKLHYKNMSLGVFHRGTFDHSECVKELLNCWENIKSDIVCTFGIAFESVCGLLRQHCTDTNEVMPYKNSATAPVHEGFCDKLYP